MQFKQVTREQYFKVVPAWCDPIPAKGGGQFTNVACWLKIAGKRVTRIINEKTQDIIAYHLCCDDVGDNVFFEYYLNTEHATMMCPNYAKSIGLTTR